MIYPISKNETEQNFSQSIRKLFLILSGIILFMVGITILQDFLESKRNGYGFYFGESLLFKTVWFLYMPFLAILYKRLKDETLDSLGKTAVFILIPITVHLFIQPFVAAFFAGFFFEGQYDLFKFFSYTLTHDLYTLILIYTGFVLGYKFLSMYKKNSSFNIEREIRNNTIIINNGKHNIIVNVKDILQITSATPYISIHLENKKYLHSETLKSIHNQLDGNIFIRVHKSTLVNLSKVNSFKSRLNGDYDLEMTDGSVVRLSRTYAADFKNHFKVRSSG